MHRTNKLRTMVFPVFFVLSLTTLQACSVISASDAVLVGGYYSTLRTEFVRLRDEGVLTPQVVSAGEGLDSVMVELWPRIVEGGILPTGDIVRIINATHSLSIELMMGGPPNTRKTRRIE